MHELAPDVSSFATLVNPGTPSEKLDTVEIETISRTWRASSASVIKVGTDAEIDSVFAELAARKAAVVIGTDTFYFAHRAHIADVAAQKRVPAIHYAREFVTAGGLMSYGTNIPDIYRQAGVYAARVLKGEKPAEMPVQLPTKFELVINLKTAKALGLTVPTSLLAQADELIGMKLLLDTQTVVSALIKQAKTLPNELYETLTWTRGKELADHRRFTLATNIDVYFCDPQSPWQRGSNENTNGLLRQYFPSGTDLSVYSQTHLNKVARQLNAVDRLSPTHVADDALCTLDNMISRGDLEGAN